MEKKCLRELEVLKGEIKKETKDVKNKNLYADDSFSTNDLMQTAKNSVKGFARDGNNNFNDECLTDTYND
jgi:hypothetical protein